MVKFVLQFHFEVTRAEIVFAFSDSEIEIQKVKWLVKGHKIVCSNKVKSRFFFHCLPNNMKQWQQTKHINLVHGWFQGAHHVQVKS